MAEELDNNEIQILTLTDEDGNDRDFEVVDTLDYEGETYYALQEYFENVADLDPVALLLLPRRDDAGFDALTLTGHDDYVCHVEVPFL